MKKNFDRVLLVQPESELSSYTSALLDEIGFRHVLHAATPEQAEQVWNSAQAKKRPIQVVICDDAIDGGALSLEQRLQAQSMVIISSEQNHENVRIAARVGLSRLMFKPYGREQLEKCISKVIS